MKKYFVLILMFVFIPVINVNALKCYETSLEYPLDLESIDNFSCSDIKGESITFKYKDKDYSSYFEFDKENERVNIKDKKVPFDTLEEVSNVVISDGVDEVQIFIKNCFYVTTTTTAIKNPNLITYTVVLDKNDGSNLEKKECDVEKEGEVCTVTLPKLDKENFTGWGTAKTCKEGKIGSTRVDKNITYYPCYSDNENDSRNDIFLSSLKVYNGDTSEEIDFGVFSIKKLEYEFSVPFEVESIKLFSASKEGVEISYDMDEKLNVGENEILIKLDDGTNKKEYKLLINRLNEGEGIEINHYLKTLVIGGFPINFNKEVLNYTVTIPKDVNKLEINSFAENESDKIEIKGNENLENGSKVLINVQGEDEGITTYTLNIIKESQTNYLLLIAIIVIFILIVVLIILIIIKNKNNKSINKTNNNQKAKKNDNSIEVLML